MATPDPTRSVAAQIMLPDSGRSKVPIGAGDTAQKFHTHAGCAATRERKAGRARLSGDIVRGAGGEISTSDRVRGRKDEQHGSNGSLVMPLIPAIPTPT